MNAEAKQALQVLFCGEEFTWGFKFSKEALDAEPDIEARHLSLQCRALSECRHRVSLCHKAYVYPCMHVLRAFISDRNLSSKYVQVRQCRREDVAANIGTAHMAVPLMSRLDADMLAKAHNLKVILQYGVGVEGIDIPTVSSLITPHGWSIVMMRAPMP